jgi:tocopherol O-methyltransferase
MSQETADYYDRNTRRFLRWGHGGRDLAIHRAVWGPGVRSRTEAIHYVHDLIAGLGTERNPVELWDLGCGVGGSIVYLAARLTAKFVGVTISGVQAEMANTILRERGLADRCRVVEGSYLDRTLLSGGRHPRMLYAIESFVHGTDHDQFFAATAGAAREDDTLVICDDFLSEDAGEEDRWVNEYRDRWHVSTLLTRGELTRAAGRSGWTVETVKDLSDTVEIGRPRDRLVRLVTALARPVGPSGAFWDNLFGGNALQVGLEKGLIRYLFITLRR